MSQVSYEINLDSGFSPSGEIKGSENINWDEAPDHGVYATKQSDKGPERWFFGFHLNNKTKTLQAFVSFGNTGDQTYQQWGEIISPTPHAESTACMTGFPGNKIRVYGE